MSAIEARLSDLGLSLPSVPAPIGNYVPFVLTGKLLFISGQGPKTKDDQWCRGQVGGDLSIEVGYQHARLAGVRLLAVAKAALGDLDRVRQVVKLLAFVNASPDFRQHPAVANGCSDMLVQVFEERGRHARSVIGAGSLPENMSVEIEAVLEFD
jgi:enamine deaminase RidA (YjgF/YER057c/UK114 family)